MLGVLLWYFRRSRLTVITAGLLALSLVGHLGIIGTQWATAAKNGYPGQLLTVLDTEKPDRTETYTTFDGIEEPLDIWLPEKADGDAPILFWIHGGSRIEGSAEATFHARWLADQGYIAVSAEYPLSFSTEHYWGVTEDQLAGTPEWVRDNANNLGGDINKLAAGGDSAEGNLSINLAYRANQGTLKGIEGEVPQFKAVTASYPAMTYNNPDPVRGDYSQGAAAS